jgi:hypothetical protein
LPDGRDTGAQFHGDPAALGAIRTLAAIRPAVGTGGAIGTVVGLIDELDGAPSIEDVGGLSGIDHRLQNDLGVLSDQQLVLTGGELARLDDIAGRDLKQQIVRAQRDAIPISMGDRPAHADGVENATVVEGGWLVHTRSPGDRVRVLYCSSAQAELIG